MGRMNIDIDAIDVASEAGCTQQAPMAGWFGVWGRRQVPGSKQRRFGEGNWRGGHWNKYIST